ncbi:MAG: asparaginase [Marinilabiliaceae bacterium]|nr:asparaginase [Marinilabiliaceae bacterium]
MVRDPETGSLVPFDFEHILDKVPELKQFDFGIDTISFDPIIDSSNMTPEIWIRLVEIIESNYHEYSGFVILHGTDTMAYTASALSFMLHNLEKPVVFTGSQLPMGMIRTDGKENLITAIEIAADRKDNMAQVPEVCVFFQDKLYRGNRTTKYNAENFRAFRSDNYPPLAEIGLHIKYNYPFIRYRTMKEVFFVSKKMDNRVALLKIFPGISESMVRAIFEIEGVRAVVMETFGSGNAPNASWFIDLVKQAVDKGVIILNVTQCLAGSVEMWRYETGVKLEQLGVVNGYDLTTEAAITKMMFLLGRETSITQIKRKLNKSLRGEI